MLGTPVWLNAPDVGAVEAPDVGDPNKFVVVTDWHVSDDGGGNVTSSAQAAALVAHIRDTIRPAGVVNFGDNKDDFVGGGDEMDLYIANVRDNGMPWATVNSGQGFTALVPDGPGNHDEDQDVGAGTVTDWTTWNAKMWSAPYHWTADWAAPDMRVIFVHAEINHTDPLQSFFTVSPTERQWFADQMAALPAGMKVIVGCHAPILNSAFGAGVRPETGGTELLNTIAAHASKVVAVMTGHRHQNMASATQDGVLHISCAAVAYGEGADRDGFVVPVYDPGAETITFEAYRARAPFAAYPGYTPLEVSIAPDTTGPAGVALTLDGGAATTTDRVVSAAITTTDPGTLGYEVKFWGDVEGAATEGAAAWTPLASPHNVTVTGGNALKTVNARMRDADDNESDVATDTITLNEFSPASLSPVQWSKTYEQLAAVADAATIAQLDDYSGSGNHLLQATEANKPTKRTSVGGRALARFDGSNDFMSDTFTLAQPVTIFCVAKFNAAFTANAVLMDGTAGNNMLLYRLGSTSMGIFAGTNLASTAFTPEAWHVYLAVFDGASSSLREDGVAKLSGNAGTATPGGLTVGRQVGGAAPANIDVVEFGVIPRLLTTQERDDLEAYLLAVKAAL